MNLTIKKIEKLLSNHLRDPVWLVKRNNIYIVQRIADGNFEKYKNLRFNKLSDVLDFIEEREEWKKKYMVIKGWIKEGSWLDRSLYIVPEKDKNKETYDLKIQTRLDKLLYEFDNKFVQLRYAIKNKKFDDITEELFNQLYGDLDNEDIDFNISEITINSYRNNIIGGHNITEALRNHIDKYVIIEVEEVEKPSWLEQTEN